MKRRWLGMVGTLLPALLVAPANAQTGRGPYARIAILRPHDGDTRLEFTTVDLVPGAAKAFEAALGAEQSRLQGETLWYRMVAGGTAPRYVRLRPRPSLSAILEGLSEQALPDKANHLITRTTVEILTLRPTMSYGLSPARP